jgi:hypothetical protein
MIEMTGIAERIENRGLQSDTEMIEIDTEMINTETIDMTEMTEMTEMAEMIENGET